MELIRIGDKVVSVPKIERAIREILKLRSKGLSQQETERLKIDGLLFRDLNIGKKYER